MMLMIDHDMGVEQLEDKKISDPLHVLITVSNAAPR
jgi:hypothetical protein